MFPILFSVGDFPIGTYGAMIALGILTMTFVSTYAGPKRGVSADDASSLVLVPLVSAYVGAKVMQVIVEWDRYAGHFAAAFNPREGGHFYGAVIGSIVGGAIFAKLKGLSLAATGDTLATAFPAAHVFGRLGCFFAGCCYGVPTESFLGLRFPSSSVAFKALHRLDPSLVADAHTVPLVPVQLLEAGGELVIFLILLRVLHRRPPLGTLFFGYIGLYALLRFTLEIWRFDPERGYVVDGWLSTSQFIALIMAAVAGYGMVWLKKNGRPPPAEATADPSARSGAASAGADKTVKRP